MLSLFVFSYTSSNFPRSSIIYISLFLTNQKQNNGTEVILNVTEYKLQYTKVK